jgi:uncharacterized delta-60 repeat protein
MLLCAVSLLLAAGSAGAARAAAPGSLDPSFGGGITSPGTNTRLFGTAVQSDGKVVAVGETGVGSSPAVLLARFTSSGALDPSFGSGGLVRGPAVSGTIGSGSIGRAVAVQPDGKIVVVGKATSSDGIGRYGVLVERYDANGSLDSTFGQGGVVLLLASEFGDGYAVAIQPDGKIVATGSADTAGTGGTAPRVAVIRLNSSGGLDGSFGAGGIDVVDLGPYSYAYAVAVQSDGKIVLAGSQAPGLQVPNALIARLTASGALDTSFAGTGSYGHQYALGAANSGFNAVAVQGDGRIVAAGAAVRGSTLGNSVGADAVLARFTSSGAPDPSFGSGGAAYTSSAVNSPPGNTGVPGAKSVLIAPNGDIVAAGVSVSGGVETTASLWAFTPSGSLDSRFGSGGAVTTVFQSDFADEYSALALAPNGDLAAVGDAQAAYEGAYAGIAARYIGFGPPPLPPLKVLLTGLKGSYKTATVVKHGLKVGVNCNEACTIAVSLVASTATARQLHILSRVQRCKKTHGHRRCVTVRVYQQITLARGKATLGNGGLHTFVLKLSRSAAKALKAQRGVKLTLRALVTSPASHKHSSISKTFSFKR